MDAVPPPPGDAYRSSIKAMDQGLTTESEPTRFSVGVLLAITLFVAVVFAGYRAFGANGIAPACAFVAVIWFAVSRTRTLALYPMNRKRITVVELLTILAICLILHGLTLPAVQSGPHRRRAAPAPPGPQMPITNGSAVDVDGEL